MGKINLVKYAGDFWVTLADYTQTRDTEGYSDHASVKSAIRTFVVKQCPDKYVAFRGETQLKNIIHENKNNPMFNPDDFTGTRTALIQWGMLDALNERFTAAKDWKKSFIQFMEEAEERMEAEGSSAKDESGDGMIEGRSTVLRQLRGELHRMDKEIEVRMNNREKILHAINAIESLELEDI